MTDTDAARAGDPEAFGRLAEGLRGELERYAYRKTGDRATAEDRVQEAFKKALEDIHRRPTGLQVRPWLYRILSNEIVTRGREHKRAPTYSLDERLSKAADDDGAADEYLHARPPVAHGGASDARDPLEVLLDTAGDEDARRRGLLTAALGVLDKADRALLLDRVAHGLGYADIARKHGLSEKEARARVEKARRAAKDAAATLTLSPAVAPRPVRVLAYAGGLFIGCPACGERLDTWYFNDDGVYQEPCERCASVVTVRLGVEVQDGVD